MKFSGKYATAVLLFLTLRIYSQSIVIGGGAEINVDANSDICATNWGNITGNITGSGTQCSGVLPVELISFTAEIGNERKIKLRWITAVEINNKGFDVERSPDGNNWEKTGWISGNGNTNNQTEYAYTDEKPVKGLNYYRLKQIDYNGNFEYFELTGGIEIKPPALFSVSQNYPNPSNPVSTIDYRVPLTSKVIIKVFDVTRREVSELINKTMEAGYYEVLFDGKNLSSGVYIYTITADDGSNRFSASKKMLLIK